MRNAHPKMKSKAGRSSPLSRSMLRIVIDDLLAEYELSHVFHNESDEDIEAVYSFPVPLDAAFGGMDATLDHRTFSASVLPARAAERTYDEAIEQGDSAVLLEEVSPGMLCVNLGNLRPGEQGEIVLRFSAAVAVADGRARFSVPLVQRPRYGWHDGDPRTVPQHDFAVVHPLEADIRVRGLLAGRPVQCSVSGARFAHVDGETSLRLDAAMLDRDLVLVFDLDATPTARARRVEDGDGAMAVANFTLPAAEGDMPLDIALLLDGSGSMTGDLRYFAREICGMQYEHLPVLAPTQPMLDGFKKKGGSWDAYAKQFTSLMRERRIEELDRESLDGACLLCSEDKPHACHRRLVAEYLGEAWAGVEIEHL